MSRDTWPNEDEQFEAYRAVVKTMAGKPVTVRTLDVGADKELEGATRQEDNPALGLRAIRFCLAEPKMFLTQLRALLRASQFGKLKILIPMLASSHEIDQTLVLLDKAKAQLRERKIKFDEAVRSAA
jgi:phosphotransferase system enzyme I (PtsI)